MLIVIPMAGNSSRFFKEGFKCPKYELDLWGKPVLWWVLQTFRRYFQTATFLFVCRESFNATETVTAISQDLGIAQHEIIELATETSGQGETVYRAIIDRTGDEQLIIFNADSFHLNFMVPDPDCDGLIDVFEGEGNHWSFVEAGEEDRVRRTTEKDRISNLCSDGMYVFRNSALYRDTYEAAFHDVVSSSDETYIAPMYNYLIASGGVVKYRLIDYDRLFFCGKPDEYRRLLAEYPNGLYELLEIGYDK